MRGLKAILIIWVFCLLSPVNARAAMSSTHYFIYADSVGFGGGLTTSTSYNVESTVGGAPIGITSSTSYTVKSGYQAMERGEISLTVDTNSVSLGNLNIGRAAVSTGNVAATVKTDSLNGYSLCVDTVTGAGLAAVSDGAVDGDSSSEEYGVSVSGSDAAFADDRAITIGLVLASNSAEMTTDRISTVTFKAIVNTVSAIASYSQTISLAAVANL